MHLLQAAARRAGHQVDVFYANIVFAKHIGEFAYLNITEWPTLDLLGERVMGMTCESVIPGCLLKEFNSNTSSAANQRGCEFKQLSIESISNNISSWLNDLSRRPLFKTRYDVVGFSSTFEQTNGLRLLATLFREHFPSAVLIAGGANCEGEMANAILKYIKQIDFVFSGESEEAFVTFLNLGGSWPSGNIIESGPNSELDALPPISYDEFFVQLDSEVPNSITRSAGSVQLPYESSRGCWWGHKHHCTFCGLNGNGMGFREKSPEKVVREISSLSSNHSVSRICMTDNIMPSSYFKTVLPALAELSPKLDIFYEQKANISLEKAISLKKAGINRIQPGIEALNDQLLIHMKKGTTGKQNLALLRYARILGIGLAWNLLSGFPDEEEWWYTETADWLTKMSHLEPPNGICKVSIDRFNPYFENPVSYGITNVRPHESYVDAFPHCDNLNELAYHFVCDSNALPFDECKGLQDIKSLVDRWRKQWRSSSDTDVKPALEVVSLGGDRFMLIDTRGLPGNAMLQEITLEQARAALVWSQDHTEDVDWGLKAGVVISGRGTSGFIPLACSDVETIRSFERSPRFEGVELPREVSIETRLAPKKIELTGASV